MGVTLKHEGFLLAWSKCPKINFVFMIVQLCAYTEKSAKCILFKLVHFTVYELYLNNAILKRTPQTIRNYNIKTERHTFKILNVLQNGLNK